MSTCIIHMYRHIFNRLHILYVIFMLAFWLLIILDIFSHAFKKSENILLNFTCQTLLNQFLIVRHLIILLFATRGSSPLYKYFVFLWTSLMISSRLNNTFHVLFYCHCVFQNGCIYLPPKMQNDIFTAGKEYLKKKNSTN